MLRLGANIVPPTRHTLAVCGELSLTFRKGGRTEVATRLAMRLA